MDAVLGVTGAGYTLLLADQASVRGIMRFNDEAGPTKLFDLDERKVIAATGANCDRVRFAEYVQRNIALKGMQTDLEMSMNATAYFIRSTLATSLRSRRPYQTNVLLGGVDDETGPELYYMDYMGALQKVNFAAHGYSSYFALSIMDRYWKPDMTLEEGKALLRKCVEQLRTRFLVSLPSFMLKIITADGITVEEM